MFRMCCCWQLTVWTANAVSSSSTRLRVALSWGFLYASIIGTCLSLMFSAAESQGG